MEVIQHLKDFHSLLITTENETIMTTLTGQHRNTYFDNYVHLPVYSNEQKIDNYYPIGFSENIGYMASSKYRNQIENRPLSLVNVDISKQNLFFDTAARPAYFYLSGIYGELDIITLPGVIWNSTQIRIIGNSGAGFENIDISVEYDNVTNIMNLTLGTDGDGIFSDIKNKISNFAPLILNITTGGSVWEVTVYESYPGDPLLFSYFDTNNIGTYLPESSQPARDAVNVGVQITTWYVVTPLPEII